MTTLAAPSQSVPAQPAASPVAPSQAPSSQAPTSPDRVLPVAPALVARFTIEQYHHMIDAGVFANDERFELLDGWVVHKMTRNPPHDYALIQLQGSLLEILGRNWTIRQQSGVTIGQSEPEPDFCITLGPSVRYRDHHPGIEEIRIVVEVSDSSLRLDRGPKLRVYADAGIPTYWIVNIPQKQIEVYTDPTGPDPEPTYRNRRDYRSGEKVPIVLDGQPIGELAVSDIILG